MCCGLIQAQTKKLQVTEMKMLRLTVGMNSLDRVKIENVGGTLGITDIGQKLVEKNSRLLDHINSR